MKRDSMPSGFDWAIVDDREQGIFRVNRQVFTDTEVFEHERRQIFEKCWLYAAHVSELAASGAFISRVVGGLPLILNRDKGGKLHAFFNSCPHRGAMVCREPQGRARNFTCPYHGWVFSDEGRAIHRPLPESYSPACAQDESLHLRPVPRFELFPRLSLRQLQRGHRFARRLPGRGGRLPEDDRRAGRGQAWSSSAARRAYSARANWKLLQENSADGYHADTTHSTYFEYIKNREGTVKNSFGKGFGRCATSATATRSRSRPTPRPGAGRWPGRWTRSRRSQGRDGGGAPQGRRPPRRGARQLHLPQRPQPADLPEPRRQRHHGPDGAHLLPGLARLLRGQRLGAGAEERGRRCCASCA
jgi:p-cumate 2,3-dioxygenase alpha subunit